MATFAREASSRAAQAATSVGSVKDMKDNLGMDSDDEAECKECFKSVYRYLANCMSSGGAAEEDPKTPTTPATPGGAGPPPSMPGGAGPPPFMPGRV